jgi:hypothetical protein
MRGPPLSRTDRFTICFADRACQLWFRRQGLGNSRYWRIPLGFRALPPMLFADCQAVVILADPEKRSSPSESSLRIAFQLTAPEARLAAWLTAGDFLKPQLRSSASLKKPDEIHLKNFYVKTGVHRQYELVAVLASF